MRWMKKSLKKIVQPEKMSISSSLKLMTTNQSTSLLMFQMPKRKREEKMKPTSKTAQRNN
jgi:hypothetical protein